MQPLTFKSIIAISMLALIPSQTVMAGEAEDRVLEQVKQTYGIHKLKSLSIYSDYRVGNRGQGFTPVYSEFTPLKYETHHDFKAKRGSSENWDGNYHFRNVTTDEGLIEIDYMNNTYELDTDGTFYRAVGGAVPRSDTLLAYELVSRPEQSVLKETVHYRGTPHHIMTLSISGWAPMNIYVNAETGHITKMQRNSRLGQFNFEFGDFKKTSGVTYAGDYSFFMNDHLSEMTQKRHVKVNRVRQKDFKIERGLEPLRAKMDRSVMTFDTIGDKVLYVGKGIGYSAFIDAGSYVIGTGATSGLSDRIEAYKTHMSGVAKPLRYFIVDHHHEDHLRGLTDAGLEGTILIVPDMAADSVREAIGGSIAEDRIQTVSGKTSIGPVEVHNISTSHVKEFALTYLPEEKTLIQVDHMGALFINGPGFAKKDTLSLKSEIDRLGLEVDKLISLHNRKVESWADFSSAVAAFNPDLCPSRRPICP